MMKKCVFIVFTLFLLCTVLLVSPKADAATVSSGNCGAEGDNVTWTLDDQGVLTISGTGAMKEWYYGNSNRAPWYSQKDTIKAVVIESGVTTIGNYAFDQCSNLTSVSIPDSVVKIATDAFCSCINIENVYYNAVKLESRLYDGLFTYSDEYRDYSQWDQEGTITVSDFNDAKSMEITIGPDVQVLPEKLFKTIIYTTRAGDWGDVETTYETYGLKISKITFEGAAPQFAENAFEGVTTKVYYPSKEASWTQEVCRNYGGSITWVAIVDSNLEWTTDGTSVTITGLKDKTLTELNIPSIIEEKPVTAIAPGAFTGCTMLTKITLPNTILTSGRDAFKDCTALKEVHISDMAAWCNITFDGMDSNPVYKSGKLYLNNTLVTNLVIPEGVTGIGDYAFCGCTDIKNIIFACSAIQIGENAFKTVTATASHDINDRTWNAETKQNYGGTLTWTTYGEIKTFEIPVARMILGNALEFQFGVEKTAQTSWVGAYAVIEKSWADGTTTQKIIPFAQWGTADQYYAIVYDGLAAKEMADEFTVTIYNGDHVAISQPKYDSVRAYVERAFDSQPDTGKTMMVDMLNYGAAAQGQFKYNLGDLANSKLTDAQKTYGTADAPAMANYRYKGPNYEATRFVLESRIQVQMAFSGLTDDMHAIYNYTDSSGKAKSVRVESDEFITAGDKRGIELSQLVYADARGVVTIMVYNADGTIHGMAIDSIESCASRSSGDVFEALMKFADSAKAHLYS